ncbi:MAG: hypothetical protein AB7P16_30270 [Bradyrhizobium sp.]|uniref:hypothetical protein n=1 Tax=Bradyrhizobium sp. TaxID=376 RepID=UPI003D0986CE
MAHRSAGKAELIDKMRRPYVDAPFHRLTLTNIARASGVSMWAVRYWFDNVERGFRAVANHLIEQVRDQFTIYDAKTSLAVHDAISDYADFVASIMRSPDYVDLLSLVLRNGCHHTWLARAFERDIVKPASRRLEDIVLDAGHHQGLVILMKEGTARRFYRRLESEFALPIIVRPTENLDDEGCARLMQDIVREAFEATYLFDLPAHRGQPRSLETTALSA